MWMMNQMIRNLETRWNMTKMKTQMINPKKKVVVNNIYKNNNNNNNNWDIMILQGLI